MRQGSPLCLLLLKTVSEALAEAIRHEKKIPWLYFIFKSQQIKDLYRAKGTSAHSIYNNLK